MPKLISVSKITSVLFVFLFAVQTHAQHTNQSENAQLTVLVRQLDMLERTAIESRSHAQNNRSRYYFDYSRLHDDIQRVKTGIYNYLTPQRAQPRNPVEITGDYIRERPPLMDVKGPS